jgi:DNA-directed RNA polymerase subunit F
MNQTDLILKVVEDLYQLAQHIDSLIKVEPEKANEEKKVVQDKPIAVEEVRAILAEKSLAGKQEEIRALIVKYGADKLTDLDPSCYNDLLKEVEAL